MRDDWVLKSLNASLSRVWGSSYLCGAGVGNSLDVRQTAVGKK